MRKGFTLIEVFIAIAVLSIGIGGVFSLVRQTVSFAPNTAANLTATYLVQEGMEIARNIRDTNFLKIHKGQGGAWTDGILELGCEAGCEADYDDTSLRSSVNNYLKLDGGFYNYDLGSITTVFTRKITVVPGGTDPVLCPEGGTELLCVTAEVFWQERGRTQTVRGSSKLYNWLTPSP